MKSSQRSSANTVAFIDYDFDDDEAGDGSASPARSRPGRSQSPNRSRSGSRQGSREASRSPPHATGKPLVTLVLPEGLATAAPDSRSPSKKTSSRNPSKDVSRTPSMQRMPSKTGQRSAMQRTPSHSTSFSQSVRAMRRMDSRNKFKNAFKRKRFKVLAGLVKTLGGGSKQDDGAESEPEMFTNEPIVNGPMIDALERQKTRIENSKTAGRTRHEEFIRMMLDPSNMTSELPDEEIWRLDPIFQVVAQSTMREKLVATMEEEIDTFWRNRNNGARPRPEQRRWSQPSTQPSARPRANDGHKVDVKKGENRFAWYARSVLTYNRHSSALVHRADAWLAKFFPTTRKGLHKKRALVGTFNDMSGEGSDGKAAKGKAKKQLVLQPVDGERISPNLENFSDEEVTQEQVTPPRRITAPSPTLRPGSRLKEMSQLRESWGTARPRPVALRRARLRDLPCDEVPPGPARWLFEEGREQPRAAPGVRPRPGQRPFNDPLRDAASKWPPQLAPEVSKTGGSSPSNPREANSPAGGGDARKSVATPDSKPRRSHTPGSASGKSPRGSSMLEKSASLPQLGRRPARGSTPATATMLSQVEEQERAATPMRAACSPTKHVLHSASSGGKLPDLPLFAADRFPTLAAKVRNLGSGDRVALTAEALNSEAVQGAYIEEVDLGGNTKLEEHQLAELINSLCQREASIALKKLSLRRCVCAGGKTLDNIIRLLSGSGGALELRNLDLSGVQIPLKCHIPLCAAIKTHPALQEVRMADSGLGSGVDVKRCMGDLFSSRTVRVMDLSWNCFSADVFQNVGERLADNQVLKSLSLANCSAAVFNSHGGDVCSAAAHFAEALGRDRCLRRLDLSLNRVDFRGAICLEDAMESNRDLRHLDLSHNPLGATGMRCIMRMLAREGSGIESLVCEGCGKGYLSRSEFPWEPAAPGARYHLDLARPQDRALFRKIIKLCHHLGAQASDCLLDLQPNPKAKLPEEKDRYGVIQMPMTGKISFVFSLAKAMEAKLGQAAEFTRDAGTWLGLQSELLRLPICRKKETLIIAFWRGASGVPDRQQPVLEALSKDFLITYPQFLSFCADEDDHLSTIITHLLPCLIGGTFTRSLAMSKPMSMSSLTTLFQGSQSLLSFTAENPTGHYTLSMDNPCDRAVAQQLKLLDAWEVLIDKSMGRPDVSQRGNRSHWRNERYMNLPLPVEIVSEWHLPTSGVLEVDYASSLRPSGNADPLSGDSLNNILVLLSTARCASSVMVASFRQVADQIFLKCMQLREILGLFKNEVERAELFISMAFRLIDMFNSKLVRARMDTPAAFGMLASRIGLATILPYVQPEQASFELDLSYHDHRFCLSILCTYLLKERRENLRDVSYVRADGRPDPLERGVPPGWDTMAKIPTGGVFKARYVCAPENRRFEFRKGLFETYGFWSCANLTEQDVRWWYTMSDVPVDIINLITYIMNKWDLSTPSKAFQYVVGDKPHCAFSAFEATFVKRFDGPDGEGSRRLLEIFRYFDDSGDGKVSIKEWMVLDQIWSEIRLSVQEFAQFIVRTFNETVEQCWDFFDKDKSGGVSEEEFVQSVNSLGYYGPMKTIYAFLDPMGKGSLGPESFAHLAQFERSILAFDVRAECRSRSKRSTADCG